jgi:hypothetical protein
MLLSDADSAVKIWYDEVFQGKVEVMYASQIESRSDVSRRVATKECKSDLGRFCGM